MKSWWLTVGFVFLALCLDLRLEATENRVVEIMYDVSEDPTGCLSVWVDSTRKSNECVKNNSDNKKASSAVEVHQFEIKPIDTVILTMKWQCDSTVADIQYTVMGKFKSTELLRILLGNLTKLTMPKSQKSEPSPEQPIVSKVNNKTFLKLLPVKDALVAGGYLLVTFNQKDSLNCKVRTSSGPWIFRIGTPPPRFTLSYGLVITKAAKPNEQESKDQGDKLPWRLVPSPFTFVNLNPWSGWLCKKRCIPCPYMSVGFQLGSQPFDDLVVGVTLRHEVGGVGMNFTVGTVIPMQISLDKKNCAFGVSLVF